MPSLSLQNEEGEPEAWWWNELEVVSEGAWELSEQEWCTAVEEAEMNSSIVFLDRIPGGTGLCLTTSLIDETTNYYKSKQWRPIGKLIVTAHAFVEQLHILNYLHQYTTFSPLIRRTALVTLAMTQATTISSALELFRR